ncbi:hypothetical protein JDV02_000728 [Purpureocillium takamizusanense]|uniref:Uncharacterized protein n=1 Tax=Purpureocillium takamizusanense TaxID=2060973 RepID=A0A9Q8Q6R4_9HYPO|nr:uncharacterized protein JDV02_000728 [Purpureocillium takamizusanense]UNI14050.1 hypothetical protein JDV02_000728 [Purpureocillium takamizusanense]
MAPPPPLGGASPPGSAARATMETTTVVAGTVVETSIVTVMPCLSTTIGVVPQSQGDTRSTVQGPQQDTSSTTAATTATAGEGSGPGFEFPTWSSGMPTATTLFREDDDDPQQQQKGGAGSSGTADTDTDAEPLVPTGVFSTATATSDPLAIGVSGTDGTAGAGGSTSDLLAVGSSVASASSSSDLLAVGSSGTLLPPGETSSPTTTLLVTSDDALAIPPAGITSGVGGSTSDLLAVGSSVASASSSSDLLAIGTSVASAGTASSTSNAPHDQPAITTPDDSPPTSGGECDAFDLRTSCRTSASASTSALPLGHGPGPFGISSSSSSSSSANVSVKTWGGEPGTNTSSRLIASSTPPLATTPVPASAVVVVTPCVQNQTAAGDAGVQACRLALSGDCDTSASEYPTCVNGRCACQAVECADDDECVGFGQCFSDEVASCKFSSGSSAGAGAGAGTGSSSSSSSSTGSRAVSLPVSSSASSGNITVTIAGRGMANMASAVIVTTTTTASSGNGTDNKSPSKSSIPRGVCQCQPKVTGCLVGLNGTRYCAEQVPCRDPSVNGALPSHAQCVPQDELVFFLGRCRCQSVDCPWTSPALPDSARRNRESCDKLILCTDRAAAAAAATPMCVEKPWVPGPTRHGPATTGYCVCVAGQ